ncbi:hypothetical protein DWB68_12820 [Galactobacter valiniphilus]|uniref:Uncharacterized protein n=1 Tax=Galactobacter valiniphilus TaxID=2676122 RepID=A0A399J7E2_9MICC|nr:hypothetical protein [Galactobacter valiniphilus]RII41398.1 hypothetical protein DWB68_12820 [Galactobacter valiniphilus]
MTLELIAEEAGVDLATVTEEFRGMVQGTATPVGLYPVDLLFSEEVPLESTMDGLLDCLKARYATPEYLTRR